MTDIYNRRNYTSVKIVELDTKIFKGKKPRDWQKIVKDYVYNNLAGKTITINNEDGSIEKFALQEQMKE